MSGLLSILLLRGRLPRLPYALVAVPVLLCLDTNFIAYIAPLIYKHMGGSLRDMMGLKLFFLGCNLLVLPLFVVSFSRLHDLRLTGWLALPCLFIPTVRIFVAWLVAYQIDVNENYQNIVILITWPSYVYGIVLALILLLVPGRKVVACPLPAAL